jgi:hypothetical protein
MAVAASGNRLQATASQDRQAESQKDHPIGSVLRYGAAWPGERLGASLFQRVRLTGTELEWDFGRESYDRACQIRKRQGSREVSRRVISCLASTLNDVNLNKSHKSLFFLAMITALGHSLAHAGITLFRSF